MAISQYVRNLRQRVGTDLLLLPGVAVVLRDDSGRMLLQKNQFGDWSLPAGAIDPGETPQEAAVREVREETGLHVKVERILGIVGGRTCRFQYPNGDEVEMVVTVFECTRVAGQLIDQSDETQALAWFSDDERPALAFSYPEELLRGEGAQAYFE